MIEAPNNKDLTVIKNTKMKISKLFTNARIGELADTATALINTYGTSGITEDATLQMIIDELKASNQALVFAVEKDQAISKLEEYDEARDTAVQDLYHYMQGCSRVGTELTKKAAENIFRLIQKYGVGIVKLSYAEESTQINSLLGDLSAPELESEINMVVFLGGLIDKLKSTQAQFESYYESYLGELAKNKEQRSASSIKPETLSIINNRLVKYLRSQAEFNATTYGELAQKVSIAIDRTNQNIRERRSRGDNAIMR